MKQHWLKRILLTAAVLMVSIYCAQAQVKGKAFFSLDSAAGLLTCCLILLAVILQLALYMKYRLQSVFRFRKVRRQQSSHESITGHVSQLNRHQLGVLLQLKQRTKINMLVLVALGCSLSSQAQDLKPTKLMNQTGILITIILILIPVLVGIALMIFKLRRVIDNYRRKVYREDAGQLAAYLENLHDSEMLDELSQRKTALDYSLNHEELAGTQAADDHKGLLSEVSNENSINFITRKKASAARPPVDPALGKLVCWFLGTATFWLLFGTTVGEYVGIKFISPDVDHVSWLSFGRLRPVHTNAVFWGWASLAMLGLGYYVVPRVSNTSIASLKKGWYTLILVNAAVVSGSICLMAGINNAGGEYREYIWPVMALFAGGLCITLVNFLQTIARRTSREIYISNWYIVSAVIFAIVIVLVAYLPFWQDGLGETIIQGYYMHQGVGMWFMLFMLGVTYYFLPQQLNRPIYSYSLGILAFWSQIIFYTVIGTHHFVFSSIPWWLQTVAIVGSAGMLIPVTSGSTNFFMTFRKEWHKLASSYTLPFFLVGLVFYFTGSMQGTAEAFRYTNLIWHFTDFTVAHSHITMYGIITFLLWAAIYTVVPRLTGKEPPQVAVGIHFWMALIGLLFYTVPLMYGATYRGIMWQSGKPFIDSVVFMAPYWLWRAIGGSLMWTAHLVFAYNMYKMLQASAAPDIKDAALKKLSEQYLNGSISFPIQ
ncbi:cbb3-type cytochrome c oxidase subunit I [Chitinophaga pinensis]|uniref:Cytochrome-c oxidase n=1 Tax=Chitinophaga pinensis (strain ATCC 43595 / DSM 2588 / LMG 13176 / NBRC 15968 / NCIMB 11800 / UQM 2034) TaxID=485918 RepID=A0A979G5G6_CHIPD|nr:cbb3-type cytochrome c oxidase subunit I [Chitinophaga pinensis]ACU61239.1 Cytochrome-c oxidase [Chitinophaga pinensis DSM 2588]